MTFRTPRKQALVHIAFPALLLSFVLACGPGASAVGAARVSAVVARTIAVHETMSARLVSHRGTTLLNEQGRGSGTFNCSLTVQVHMERNGGTLSFTCNPGGGTISGHGHTSFAVAGPAAYFKGTLALSRATGKYAHASVSSMHIEGRLQRGSYALSATVTGSMSL